MHKSGGLLKSWQRRWIIFDDSVMCVYANQFHAAKDLLLTINIDKHTRVAKVEASTPLHACDSALTGADGREQGPRVHVLRQHACEHHSPYPRKCFQFAQEKTHLFAGLSDPDVELWMAALDSGLQQQSAATQSNSFFYQVHTRDMRETLKHLQRGHESDDSGDEAAHGCVAR